jgi:hypothetical protein
MWPILPSNIFKDKQLQGLICLSPYVSLEIDVKGNVGLCGCYTWLPTRVGNLFKNTLDEILSSAISQSIRSSISDGSYRYCDESRCGIIANNAFNTEQNTPPEVLVSYRDPTKYLMPHEIFIAGDRTCNLSCPSCREEIFKNTDDELALAEELGDQLRKNLFSTPTTSPIKLHLSVSGELFASPLLLRFINSIPVDDFPNLELHIQTNALLAPQNWHKLGNMQHRVRKITVTTDAATPDTYETLRRGGSWESLTTALDFLQQKCQSADIQLHLRMITQLANYKEILLFYEFGKKYNVDVFEYCRIRNWGTYSDLEFSQLDVFDPIHPEFKSAQAILDCVKTHNNVTIAGGLF